MRISLALLVLGLMALAFLEWQSGEERMTRYLTTTEAPPPVPAGLPQYPDLALSPEPHYAEIAKRTLFRPERRPAPPDDGSNDAGSENLDLKTVFLTAISLGKSGQFALWFDSTDHKIQRVKVGDKIKNYRVRALKPDALVLENGGREEILPLRDYKNRPPVAPSPGRVQMPKPPVPPPPPPPPQPHPPGTPK
ncbi:MAG: hypothetical protein WCP34_05570 [Pseudomonadota bacterium]